MTKAATIIGHGVFPMDMLRYDRAYPLTSDDAVKIASTFFNKTQSFEIQVATSGNFTAERWRSFGVSIVQKVKT